MSLRIQSGLRVNPSASTGHYTYAARSQDSTLKTPYTPERERAQFCCKPGPWGHIEYDYMYLEAAEHVMERLSLPAPTARWSFRGWSREQVIGFLAGCGVPGAWLELWSSGTRMIEHPGCTHVLPVNEQIGELAPAVRGRIYAEIAQFQENEYHADPLVIPEGNVAQFLKNTGLRHEMARRFERLCYPRGAALCFSDLQTLMASAQDERESRRLFKLMTRTRAILAFLHISPQTDIAALAHYWTSGQQRKDMLPLFQSLAEIPAGLDLIHVLPPLARRYLNSYPPPEMGMHGRMPDCHWTALNFFNHEPQDYYRDTRLTAHYVVNNCDNAEPPYQYGDVLLFVSDDGQRGIHSCVYVADDLAFTKNGESALMPWVLTRLQDLRDIYRVGDGYRIRAVRPRRP